MRVKKVRQIKRNLKPSERIVIKNAKGQYRRHRKDLKVVLWVVDKKGKFLGVKNSVENGKPVARRFSGGQFTILTKPKVQAGFEIKERGETFRIYSKEPIVWQLPKELPAQVRRAARANSFGTVLVSFEIYYKADFHLFTPATLFDGEEPIADMRMAMAKMIIDALYDINVRISAKVHTDRVKNKLRRYVDVTTQFS